MRQHARPLMIQSAKPYGLTIVELLVAMVIGIVLITAALGVSLSNKNTYRINSGLARIQDTSRFTIEIMGQQIRDAGGIACGVGLPVANVITDANDVWWANWQGGLQGFDDQDDGFAKKFGTQPGDRVIGTDALITMSGTLNPISIVKKHNTAQSEIEIATDIDVKSGEVAIICDFSQAAIFQAALNTDASVIYHTPNKGAPGNCNSNLSFKVPCSNTTEKQYEYSANALISSLSSTAWYIGINSRGNSSLFRLVLDADSNTPLQEPEEIAANVIGMTLSYLTQNASGSPAGDYESAKDISPGDWPNVIAVRLELTLISSADFQGKPLEDAEGNAIEFRTYNSFSLRNRIP